MNRSRTTAPTRNDWRAVLAACADADQGVPAEPLPDDLMHALDAFLAVDDTTEPASELEIESIVRAVHEADSGQALINGWRLLAALLAVACLGSLAWSGIQGLGDVNPSPGGARGGEVATADFTVITLSTHRHRGTTTADSLPASGRIALLLVVPHLPKHAERVVVELESGPWTRSFPFEIPDDHLLRLSVDRDALPAPTLAVRLVDTTGEPLAAWTLEGSSATER